MVFVQHGNDPQITVVVDHQFISLPHHKTSVISNRFCENVKKKLVEIMNLFVTLLVISLGVQLGGEYSKSKSNQLINESNL